MERCSSFYCSFVFASFFSLNLENLNELCICGVNFDKESFEDVGISKGLGVKAEISAEKASSINFVTF